MEVRQGKHCDLDGVTVNGDLIVHEGANRSTPTTRRESTGTSSRQGANGVHLQDSTQISGNATIQSTEASEQLASQRVCGSIQGNLTITGTVASAYFIVGQTLENGGACPNGSVLGVGGTITWSDNANKGIVIGDTQSSLVVCKNNAHKPKGIEQLRRRARLVRNTTVSLGSAPTWAGRPD